MKQNKTNDAEAFKLLVQNAFDFLKHSIEEFDTAPKYSVIHFCAAVEILLKARLLKEHWSLVISKPEEAKLDDFFKAGKFQSVTLEGARKRLCNIANDDIGDKAYNSFHALAEHRNKMIHFFHPDVDDTKEAKAQIVAEHCRSWCCLLRLLERWDTYFHDFRSDIKQADSMMKKHREYLSAKFEALKPDLDDARKAGYMPKECSACGFDAAVPETNGNPIVPLKCWVCDHTETHFEFKCPHCGKTIVIVNGRIYANCPHPQCGGAIEAEHLKSVLTDWRAQSGVDIEPEHLMDALTDHDAAYSDSLDGDDSWGTINCQCGAYQTVIRLIKRDSKGAIKRDNARFLCASCLEIFDHIERCEWCNEYNTGNMENSYVFGCKCCDGQLGWEKDD
jgi:hypothetical protein